MIKPIRNFVLVCCLVAPLSSPYAYDIAIGRLQMPVVALDAGVERALDYQASLGVGHELATGAAGLAELRLGADTTLQVNSGTRLRFSAQFTGTTGVLGERPEVEVIEGRLCVKYAAVSDIETGLTLRAGAFMLADMRVNGDICVMRGRDFTAVRLRGGSVRITHTLDQNIVILGSINSEYRVEDNGRVSLHVPGLDAALASEIERPFVFARLLPREPADTPAESGSTAGSAPPAASAPAEANETALAPEKSVGSFSVYLFSSRSAEVAGAISRKLQTDGVGASVYAVSAGAEMRYRVAVPGFETRRAAETFSESVIGKFGITDAWIGSGNPAGGSVSAPGG